MSARRKLESPAPAIAFAGLAVSSGVAIIGIATGVIPYDPENLTAPRWLVALAGAMFVASAVVPLASVFPRLTPIAPMAGFFIALVLLVLWRVLRERARWGGRSERSVDVGQTSRVGNGLTPAGVPRIPIRRA